MSGTDEAQGLDRTETENEIPETANEGETGLRAGPYRMRESKSSPHRSERSRFQIPAQRR